MPMVDGIDSPVTPLSGTSGLSALQIIDMANRHTERRADKVLDLQKEFVAACQEFVREHAWWWRRLSATFNTVPGQPCYDLTSSLPDGLEYERIGRRGVKLILDKSNKPVLDPLHDPEAQDDACEDEDQTGRPGFYFLERGQQQTIRLVPTPDAVYKVRVTGWVQLNHQIDFATVPLIPGFMHDILVVNLEKRIFRYTLGEGSQKYLAAKAEYEAAVSHIADQVDFADGNVSEWKTTATNQDAIQSS